MPQMTKKSPERMICGGASERKDVLTDWAGARRQPIAGTPSPSGVPVCSARACSLPHFAFQRRVEIWCCWTRDLPRNDSAMTVAAIVVAVAGEIADRHVGIRNAGPDQSLDVPAAMAMRPFIVSRSAKPPNQ